MCFCTFENVKKRVFCPVKMDFFRNFNSLCDIVVVVGLFKCSLVVEAACAASNSKVEASDAVDEGAAFLEDAFLSIANRISSPKSK